MFCTLVIYTLKYISVCLWSVSFTQTGSRSMLCLFSEEIQNHAFTATDCTIRIFFFCKDFRVCNIQEDDLYTNINGTKILKFASSIPKHSVKWTKFCRNNLFNFIIYYWINLFILFITVTTFVNHSFLHPGNFHWIWNWNLYLYIGICPRAAMYGHIVCCCYFNPV